MDVFIIPKNEDEFIELYLDKSVYGEQIARCDILHRAMTNNLTAAEYRIHKLNGSVELFDKEYRNSRNNYSKLPLYHLQANYAQNNVTFVRAHITMLRVAKRVNI